jgi:hypothetical protein
MSDLSIVGSGNPPPPEPSAYLTPFVAADLPIGTPVAYETSVDDTVVAARANAIATSYVVGLLSQPSTSGDRGQVKSRGVLQLTEAQWNVVTGGSGGLTRGAYYLSPATAGEIQTAIPSAGGQFATLIGVAINATTMILAPQPQQPIPEASA